jgi:hypothetical protein
MIWSGIFSGMSGPKEDQTAAAENSAPFRETRFGRQQTRLPVCSPRRAARSPTSQRKMPAKMAMKTAKMAVKTGRRKCSMLCVTKPRITTVKGKKCEVTINVPLFKGTVSRDFLLLVYFMNQFPPSPRVSH